MKKEDFFEPYSPLSEETPYGNFSVKLCGQQIVKNESMEVYAILFHTKKMLGLCEDCVEAKYLLQKEDGIIKSAEVRCSHFSRILGRRGKTIAEKGVFLPVGPRKYAWGEQCKRLLILALSVVDKIDLADNLISLWRIEPEA